MFWVHFRDGLKARSCLLEGPGVELFDTLKELGGGLIELQLAVRRAAFANDEDRGAK